MAQFQRNQRVWVTYPECEPEMGTVYQVREPTILEQSYDVILDDSDSPSTNVIKESMIELALDQTPHTRAVHAKSLRVNLLGQTPEQIIDEFRKKGIELPMRNPSFDGLTYDPNRDIEASNTLEAYALR